MVTFTDEMLLCLVRSKFEIAKKDLAKTQPTGDGATTDFMPRIEVILPDGRESAAKLPWRNATEKYQWGKAASNAARLMMAQALITTVVVTALNVNRVVPELGLKRFSDVSPEEFQRRLFRWCELITGGRVLGKLPRRFRHDQLAVIGMGPRLAGCLTHQSFDWANGVPWWKDDQQTLDCRVDGEQQFAVIPKWWD